MELEGSVPRLQEAAICPYPKQYQSSPCPHPPPIKLPEDQRYDYVAQTRSEDENRVDQPVTDFELGY